MNTAPFLSSVAVASLLILPGCASIVETSNTAGAENKCKVVMAQPARLNYDPAKTTSLDKVEARAKLAAVELKQPPSRHTSMGGNGVIDQALRDCL